MNRIWPWAKRPAGGFDAPPHKMKAPERKDSLGAGFVALHMGGRARWSEAHYAALARESHMRNPVAHAAVRLIIETVRRVTIGFYRGETELVGHPFVALIDRPNPAMDRQDFLETLALHLTIGGNAYVEKVSLPTGAAALHVLRPDRVDVMAGSDGWPQALRYGGGGRPRMLALGADALHLRLIHPLDDLTGLSPLQAALMAIDTHNAASAWSKALLDNSARPSGALVYAPKEGGNLTEEQFDRLRAELDENYSGVRGAGRPMLLDGGLDWKAMALSPRDMDFIETRNAASRDIALCLGVPPMLLGIPGDNTYSNYREANRAFFRQTVLPMADRIAGRLAHWLGPDYGGGIRAEVDQDSIPGMAEDRNLLWERLGKADFITEDEKREAVGYGPLGRKGGA